MIMGGYFYMSKHKTNEDWKAILEDQKESGLPVQTYCEIHNLSKTQFYKRKRLLEEPEQIFLPVEAVEQVDDVKTSSRIVINGVAIEVSDDTSADLLNKVLDKVIRPC